MQDKFKFGWLFNRQVGRVSAFEYFIHVLSRFAEQGFYIRAVTGQPTGSGGLLPVGAVEAAGTRSNDCAKQFGVWAAGPTGGAAPCKCGPSDIG